MRLQVFLCSIDGLQANSDQFSEAVIKQLDVSNPCLIEDMMVVVFHEKNS